MKILGKIQQFFLAETSYFLPAEQQALDLLLHNPTFENIRPLLENQLLCFHHATRGYRDCLSSATFSFDKKAQTWDSGERELMCEIKGENAKALVFTGSGFLASIEIHTEEPLGMPKRLRLESPVIVRSVKQKIKKA